jgi:hypothetical protein
MKKNPVITILVLVFLVSVIVAVVIDSKKRSRIPKERDFPLTVVVATTSDRAFIIQYSKTMAYDILKLNSVVVQIAEMPQKMMPIEGDIVIEAYVIPVLMLKHTYTIFLSDKITSDEHLRRVLSHEFAHIKQYESGRLIINGDIWIWEGDTVTFAEKKWSKRPWEIDAMVEGRRINKKMDAFLYE